MKKLFIVLATVLFATSAFAQFGILLNGKTYYQGQQNPSPADPSFQEFMVLGLSVKAGDFCQLCDAGNDYATWAVNLDGASASGFTRNDNKYDISVTGCYDFYIKIKLNEDQLYVGEGGCGTPTGVDISGGQGQGGGNQGGGQGGGTGSGNPRYYYKGFIDDADFEPDDSSLFHDGIATINFTTNAMLFVIYQVDGQEGVQYMTSDWVDGPDHATLSVNGNGGYNKWNCPKGTTTLYLYDNGDGTLEISSKQIAGKTLVSGGGNQAIDNTKVSEKARKVMVDGELRIIRGEKVFDATGRQL